MTTRMLLAGAWVLALACATAALAAPAGGAGDASSTPRAAVAGAERADTCEAATAKLSKAKQRLKQLKQNGAPAQAIQQAKQKVKKAQDAVDKVCGFDPVIYDITGIDGKFDATVTQDQGPTCTPLTEDAHWTASLGPGNQTATLEVYYRDRQGRPAAYYFHGPRIVLATHGTGLATITCSSPDPEGTNGTATCNFSKDHPDSMVVRNAPEASDLKTMTIEWYWGFFSWQYNDPANGGSCTSSGARPPLIDDLQWSPSLFVNSLNDAEFTQYIEPPGITKEPLSSFGASITLTMSGSGSVTYENGTSVQASWAMTYSLHRR